MTDPPSISLAEHRTSLAEPLLTPADAAALLAVRTSWVYEAVRTAMAHARLSAENRAFEDAPVTWLKSGPGKETAHFPGWTSPVKAKPLPVRAPGFSISAERTQTLITVMLAALKPFPEARAAVADALDAHDLREKEATEALPEFLVEGGVMLKPPE